MQCVDVINEVLQELRDQITMRFIEIELINGTLTQDDNQPKENENV